MKPYKLHCLNCGRNKKMILQESYDLGQVITKRCKCSCRALQVVKYFYWKQKPAPISQGASKAYFKATS